MKLLFSLILVCFAPLVIGYESGKEYRHKLEAYVHSFIRNTKSQYAGTATIADVVVQVQENAYKIKINNIKFDVANELIEGDFFKYPFTFKDVPAFSDEISKPFKVTIEKGRITQFYISEDEPEWSVTLKKGFLNLLQLNLDHSDDSGDSNDHSHPSSDSEFFSVSESGTFGECETTYTVRSEPTLQNSEHVLNVTKIRNYEKCNKKPHPFVYASEYGLPCTECGTPTKIFRAVSLYEYSLKGTREQYVIEKIVQREQITRTPFGSDGLTFEIYSKRILELLSVQDISDPIAVSNDIIAQTDLTYAPLEKHEFFDQIDLKRAHFLHEIYRYQVPTAQIVSLIEEVVGEYASYDENSADTPLPSKFAEIIDALSTLDYEGIEQVFGALSESAEEQRKLFFDSLATSGTNPAFLFGKTLIEQNKLDGALGAQRFLIKLSLSIKEPSESLFNAYSQLCLSSGVQESRKLKQACYLSFSALVSKECVQYYFLHARHNHSHYHQHKDSQAADKDQSKHHCNPEIASKYFKLLINTDVEPTLTGDTILFIKTAGNFRVKSAIPYLKNFVQNSPSHYIRSNAAWNLVGLASIYPDDIRAIAAPLFFNTSEEQDVRIAAYNAWIYTRPQFPQILLIGRQLVFEKNRQIVNYVYTSLKGYANTELPCTQKHSSDIRNALWLFKIARDKHGLKTYPRRSDSYCKIQTRYDDQYQLGALRVFSVIASNNSYIPTSVYLSMHNLIAGKLFNTFSVSINSYGVEKVINRLFGIKGTVWKKPSKLDIFKKRVTRDASSLENEVKELEKNLPIAPRESDELHIQVTIYRKGYQLAYEELDEKLFASVIKEGTINIPDIQRILGVDIIGKTKRTFLQSLNRIIIMRSEIGLPYFFQYRVLNQLSFHSNKLNFNVIPGLFSEERDNKPATELELALDMKYTHDIDTYALSGLLMPVIYNKVGAGVNRRMIITIPFNRAFTYYVKEKKLETKRVPEPQTIFFDKVTPFTYTDSYANKVSLVAEPGFKPLYSNAELKQFERNYLQEFFGFGVKVTGNVLRAPKSEWFQFYSEKTLGEKYLYYITHPTPNPYELKVSTALPATNPTTDFTLTLSFGESASESENDVASDFSNAEDSTFSEYTSSRDDRRAEKHSVKLELRGGGNIERSINAELVYSHSEDDLLHKINLKYDRSPINDNGYKVCAVALTRFPSFDINKFVNLDTLELDQTANLTARVAFGESCDTDAAKVTVNAQMSQTDEQKHFEQTRETPDPKNPYSRYYNYCKNQFQFKYNHVPYCPRYLYPISQLRQLVATIDTENIPPAVLNGTYKMLRKLNVKRDPYLDISYNPNELSLGQIRFVSNTSVSQPIVDSSIYAPRFTAIYKSVPHSPKLAPLFTFPLYDLHYHDVIRNDKYKPFCVIQENSVQTFDNVSYTLPTLDGKCFAVLAKDCSADKVFTVLGQRVDNNRINVRLYIGAKFRVDFLTGGDDESALTIKVNGNEVPVSQSQPYRQAYKIANKEIELFSITYSGAYYRLDARKARLSLTTDGTGVLVQPGRYYTGKLCGLCGDSNGDASYEFRAPNLHVYRNSDPFVYSYLVPSDTCTPPAGDSNNDNELLDN